MAEQKSRAEQSRVEALLGAAPLRFDGAEQRNGHFRQASTKEIPHLLSSAQLSSTFPEKTLIMRDRPLLLALSLLFVVILLRMTPSCTK